MANINTPAHDFAPPWLKIPTYESSKPTGAERDRGGHASRKEGHSYGSSRHSKDNDNLAHPRHNFFNETHRDRTNFDDPFFEVNNTYTSAGCNGTNSSQSSQLRRPHSRHDFRNVPPSYAKGESFNRHVTNSSGNCCGKPKGKYADLCTNNSNNSSFNENGGINVSSNNFNQEFPSLQGDVSEDSTSPPPAINNGVWEKHRNMVVHGSGAGKKIQLIKKPFGSEGTTDSSKKNFSATTLPSPSPSVVNSSGMNSLSNPHTVIVTPVAKGGPGIYRALIPAKCTTSNSSRKTVKESLPKSQPAPKRPPIASASSSSQSMEILVKHPKAPGNKSEFLKTLRNDQMCIAQKECQTQHKSAREFLNLSLKCANNHAENSHVNGIDIDKLSINDNNEKPMLSSSLEAEQRLLREMGWKEETSDDDNYAPLTEDEMREFRALSEQISKKNGIRRSLQANFSPRRLVPYTNIPLPSDTCSSSSDSDSDF